MIQPKRYSKTSLKYFAILIIICIPNSNQIIIAFFLNKQITKKLAGGISETATWMTNITNEYGQVLNCVLTTGEGAGLEELCQGIVMRFQNAGEPEPQVLYVDRDCCSESGL